MGGRSGGSLGTTLAIVAIVLGLIAIALNFVVPGPTGPAGTSAPGPNGGAPYVYFWASVNYTGLVNRSEGVNTTSETSIGVYQVVFFTHQWGCTYQTTIATTGAGEAQPAKISVAHTHGSPDAVTVSIFNITTGVPYQSAFHIIATCPGGYSAEAYSNGTVFAGDQVVSFANVDAGGYQVVFDEYIAGCVYAGGLGTPGSTPPAGFITLAGRGGVPDGVWVATFNTAGVQTDEPFWISVTC
jgi:hypothetical protein